MSPTFATNPVEMANAGCESLPERKRLDHRGPLSVDVKSAWYFVTICAAGHRPWVGSRVPRDRDDAAHDTMASAPMDLGAIADVILAAARWYHEHEKWRLATFLVMPDHLHFVAHFPVVGGHAGRVTLPMVAVIQQFKTYLSRTYGIVSQRGFFETRIRNEAHRMEKIRYICGNPVRKGLSATVDDWPYSIAFGEDGKERACGMRGNVQK